MASRVIIISDTLGELLQIVRSVRYPDLPIDTVMDLAIADDICDVINRLIDEDFETIYDLGLEPVEYSAYAEILKEIRQYIPNPLHITILDNERTIVISST